MFGLTLSPPICFAADAILIRRIAASLERVKGADGARLIKPALVAAVDEFFSRLFEEMDYKVRMISLSLDLDLDLGLDLDLDLDLSIYIYIYIYI